VKELGDLAILRTKRKDDLEPYGQDEKDWLCIVEFLPTDNPEARLFGADIIGYLVGYANLTNTRSLALLGDPDAGADELLFSFSSPEEKNEFLNLVRSNEDMGKDYIIELTPPTDEEIRNARPLATVLPQDALTHAMLIAATVCAGREEASNNGLIEKITESFQAYGFEGTSLSTISKATGLIKSLLAVPSWKRGNGRGSSPLCRSTVFASHPEAYRRSRPRSDPSRQSRQSAP
jgi:hypothetical protein